MTPSASAMTTVSMGSPVVPSALTWVRSRPSCSWAARVPSLGAVRMPSCPAIWLPGSDRTVKVSSFDSFVDRDPSGACGLMATRPMPRSGQRGHELRLVGAQGDVAVGAPGAAVEHDDGGLAAQVLGERGRLAADVEQFPVRQ